MTTYRSAPHGASLIPLVSVVPPAAALYGWLDLNQPMHATGLGVLLFLGMLAGVLAPGALVSFESLPLLLIPDKWRIQWRKGSDRRPAFRMWLKRAIYAADRYRCCYCGERVGLQLDHVKPWSRGGLSALWNLMLLCSRCNRVKSNYWVAKDGYVFYRPFMDANKLAAQMCVVLGFHPATTAEQIAADILRFELRHRWHPGRWIRAGWQLGR